MTKCCHCSQSYCLHGCKSMGLLGKGLHFNKEGYFLENEKKLPNSGYT